MLLTLAWFPNCVLTLFQKGLHCSYTIHLYTNIAIERAYYIYMYVCMCLYIHSCICVKTKKKKKEKRIKCLESKLICCWEIGRIRNNMAKIKTALNLINMKLFKFSNVGDH